MTRYLNLALLDTLADWEVGLATAHTVAQARLAARARPEDRLVHRRRDPRPGDHHGQDAHHPRPRGGRGAAARQGDARAPRGRDLGAGGTGFVAPGPASCSPPAARGRDLRGHAGLAQAGILDARRRTSNARGSWPSSATRAPHHDCDEAVVTDGDLITATSSAPVDFAPAVLARLDVDVPGVLASWNKLFGDRRPGRLLRAGGAQRDPRHRPAGAADRRPLAGFRLNGHFLELAEELAQPAGLTAAWWQVLGAVLGPPLPVSGIARAMGITRQSVQRIADLLVGAGLAEYAQPRLPEGQAGPVPVAPAGLDAVRRHRPGAPDRGPSGWLPNWVPISWPGCWPGCTSCQRRWTGSRRVALTAEEPLPPRLLDLDGVADDGRDAVEHHLTGLKRPRRVRRGRSGQGAGRLRNGGGSGTPFLSASGRVAACCWRTSAGTSSQRV